MPYHTIRDSERLQSLISAMMLIEADAELDVLLRHLVRSACELVGAQYGALGVLDPTTQQIKEFITVGITDEVRQAIGRLPVGHGLLGEVIESGQSLRVDPMPTGGHSEFPANHPPMHNFLGAPVRTGDGATAGPRAAELERASGPQHGGRERALVALGGVWLKANLARL